MSEAELVRMVELAQRKEEKALSWLFDRYQRRMMRFCLSFASLGEADAADVTQEIFVRAFGAMDKLKNAAAFEGWLYTIARRSCLEMIRKHKRTAAKNQALAQETLAQNTRVGQPDLNDSERQRRVERTLVAKIIEELPDSDLKTAGQLFYRTGLDTKTIAQKMDAPLSTVTTWLNRFRAKIRRRLVAQVLSARGHGDCRQERG